MDKYIIIVKSYGQMQWIDEPMSFAAAKIRMRELLMETLIEDESSPIVINTEMKLFDNRSNPNEYIVNDDFSIHIVGR